MTGGDLVHESFKLMIMVGAVDRGEIRRVGHGEGRPVSCVVLAFRVSC